MVWMFEQWTECARNKLGYFLPTRRLLSWLCLVVTFVIVKTKMSTKGSSGGYVNIFYTDIMSLKKRRPRLEIIFNKHLHSRTCFSYFLSQKNAKTGITQLRLIVLVCAGQIHIYGAYFKANFTKVHIKKTKNRLISWNRYYIKRNRTLIPSMHMIKQYNFLC